MMGVLTCASSSVERRVDTRRLLGPDRLPRRPPLSATRVRSPSLGADDNGECRTSINETERKMILKRIEIDRHDVVEEQITFRDIGRNLLNIRIWAYGLLFCMSTLPVYAFACASHVATRCSSASDFLPLIFRGYGYSTALSQILSAPPVSRHPHCHSS